MRQKKGHLSPRAGQPSSDRAKVWVKVMWEEVIGRITDL